MRADENRHRDLLRPSRAMSELPDWMKTTSSPFDIAGDANCRIHSPGYRYNPVSRETYGYGPRSLHTDTSSPKYMPRPCKFTSPTLYSNDCFEQIISFSSPTDRALSKNLLSMHKLHTFHIFKSPIVEARCFLYIFQISPQVYFCQCD